MDIPLPIRVEVRRRALDLLMKAPLVQRRVYSGRAWPTVSGGQKPGLPAILLYVFRETKQPLGNLGPPAFNTTISMAVHCRASGASESAVEAQLDILGGAVEMLLLQDADFVKQVSSIGTVTTEIDIRHEGDIIVGEVAITIDVVWSEEFPPIITDDLFGMDVRIDAIDPADHVGEYTVPAPWPPAVPAPRERGPDGREEWGGPVNFPQT